MVAVEVVMVAGQQEDEHDVVVIGGSAAGLNGALMLARARRRVLVIDAGAPRNAPAAAVHGLLGRDEMAPGELLERGRAEVPGVWVAGNVTELAAQVGTAAAAGATAGAMINADLVEEETREAVAAVRR
jgi:thioredoxin reductase